MIRRVLLVDDDRHVREALGQTLMLADYDVTTAGSYIEAKDHICPEFGGIVISDIRMPGKDGFALLAFAREADPDLPVILLTGEGDIPMAVRGMSEGAFSFLEKPCPQSDLLSVVEKAAHTRGLVLENRRLKQELQSGDAAARMLFGDSQMAQALRDNVRVAARGDTEALISGAPGAGVGKVAQVIHLMSRRGEAFEKRAGASLTTDSLTQAIAMAGNGTLFIDEITAMSPDTQLSCLEALEAGLAPRILAGSFKDVAAEAHAGHFNADLYYRLSVIGVHIPALNERPEDIPVLFRHYVQEACDQARLDMPEITPDVISRLMAREWPGNSRDLMNAATRFALGLPDIEADEAPGLSDQMMQVERALLIQALQQNNGNATETAKALKLPRKTFYDKLARHGLRAEAYRG